MSRSLSAAATLFVLVACGGGTSLPKDPAERERLAAQGAELFKVHACVLCHGEKVDRTIGPSLAGIFGREAVFNDGSTRIRDDAYLFESIVEPQRQILKGYANTMPPNPTMARKDVLALVAYVRGL